MIQKITDSATQKIIQSPSSSSGSWDGLLPSQSTPQMGEFICAVQLTDRDSKLVFPPILLQTTAYQCDSPEFHRKVCGDYLRRNVYYRIIEYRELERTDKDYKLQLVAPLKIQTLCLRVQSNCPLNSSIHGCAHSSVPIAFWCRTCP